MIISLRSRYFLLIIIAVLVLLIIKRQGFALDTAPDPIERQRDEYRLKKLLQPILIDILKDEYLALSVNVMYILQHEPVINNQTKITKLVLPGFGTKITLNNKGNSISGYIDRYERYYTLVLMVTNRLFPSVENNIVNLFRERGHLDIGGKDTLKIMIVADERKEIEKPDEQKLKKEKNLDNLIHKIKKDNKEKEKRLAKLFPNLKKPLGPVDPRDEAESSKHLILSRKAFYKNDLNTALNEVIEAININPSAPKSYEMLGSIYYRLKWNSLALNNWEKALALDPENKKLSSYVVKLRKQL